MNHVISTRPLGLLIGALALAWAGQAVAATHSATTRQSQSEATSRFQQERARCLTNQSNQDRATCLREATAALAEARRGTLDDRQAEYDKNARLRCQALPAADQSDCRARIDGHGNASGSAEAGGIYRELVTRDAAGGAARPATAASAPAR